jgi:hypothetical protein
LPDGRRPRRTGDGVSGPECGESGFGRNLRDRIRIQRVVEIESGGTVMRTPRSFVAAAAMATLFLALTSHPPTARGDETDAFETALARLEAAQDGSSVSAICEAVRDLAGIDHRKVDDVLRRIASGAREDKVCAEAARALGMRGNRRQLSFLLRLLDAHEDRPYALIGVLEGIGAFRSVRAADPLYDVARSNMMTQERVAKAAIEALGAIHHRKAVDLLVKLLAQTELRQGYGPDGMTPTGPISSEAQTKVAAYQEPIRVALHRLTGIELMSVEDWTSWWRSEKRRFRLPPAPPDPNRRLGLRDEKRWFEIMRPSIAWRWLDDPEPGFQRTCARKEEGRTVAWVSVHAHSTKEEDPITVASMLRAQQDDLERRFATIREKDWGSEGEFAGEKATIQHVRGHFTGEETRLTQAVFKHGYRMFVVRWAVVERAERRIGEETKRMVDSLRLLD